jgi:hypothetical protein
MGMPSRTTIELYDEDLKDAEIIELYPRGRRQLGKIGWALLWLLGVPLPILILIYLLRGH